MVDKVKQGKRNRAAGAAFELRTRKDMEAQGFFVDKWGNNVEFNIEHQGDSTCVDPEEVIIGKLVPAKRKWSGPGRPMAIGTGFPDYIAIKTIDTVELELGCIDNVELGKYYEVIGVECKTNGRLDKTEKEKCVWLLDNKIFARIYIASKTKVKNKIVIEYNEFKK